MGKGMGQYMGRALRSKNSPFTLHSNPSPCSRGSNQYKFAIHLSPFLGTYKYKHICCCSVAQLCQTLCDPMDCSTPGFPVLHHLPELDQTHVHWVGDAIQPSHSVIPFSCLQYFPASGYFQMSQLFGSGGQSTGVSASTSVLPMNTLGLISFRMDWLDLLAVQGTQESSPTPQFKSINSSVLSFLYSPTPTSIHGYWKNHSLE